jgi:glutaconate CoA-transferase, subunit A
MTKDQSKLIEIDDALKKIRSGMTLGFSGFSYMNPPMAFVRGIIKKKIKNLTIVSGPTSGIETDMLIGAGCVKKVITSGVAFEKVVGVAPNFRRAAEKDEIDIWECDESIWHIALKAGIYDVPYILWRGGLGTSIPELNKEIEEVTVNNRKYLKIPQVKIDLSFLHCGISDIHGNVQFPKNIFLGRVFCEQKIALASRDVVCSVEKIVPNKVILKNPERTIIRDAQVIEIPFGAHPGASNGFYIPDLDHFREYVKYCKDGKFNDYLEMFALNPIDHEGYINLIGKNKLGKLKLIGKNGA